MIATVSHPTERARRRSDLQTRRLKERCDALLTREVAFIPNPVFRELDAEQAWESELELARNQADLDVDWTVAGQLRMPAHLEPLCLLLS